MSTSKELTLVLAVLPLLLVMVALPTTVQATELGIAYDDGAFENSEIVQSANAAAVRFTPVFYPTRILKARFFITWNSFLSPAYRVWILDDDGTGGTPGTTLYGPFLFWVDETAGWVEYEIPETINVEEGDFYIAYQPSIFGLDGQFLGIDTSNPDARSWRFENGSWSELTLPLGDFMIRAVVNPSVTGVVPEEPPRRLILRPNHPNPFRAQTNLVFETRSNGPVLVMIYDLAGRQMAKPVDANFPAGKHQVLWDGTDSFGRELPAGVYLMRLETTDGVKSRKIVRVD
jgi:hypothetical protein